MADGKSWTGTFSSACSVLGPRSPRGTLCTSSQPRRRCAQTAGLSRCSGVWKQAVLGQHLLTARGGVRGCGVQWTPLTPDCVLGERVCIPAGPEGSASPRWFRGASGCRRRLGACGLRGNSEAALNHYSCGSGLETNAPAETNFSSQDKSELRTRKMHPDGASTRLQRNARPSGRKGNDDPARRLISPPRAANTYRPKAFAPMATGAGVYARRNTHPQARPSTSPRAVP